MEKIRKIIKTLLPEIIDSYALPADYAEENDRATFTVSGLTYWVKFTPFEMAAPIFIADEKLLKIINNTNNKYLVDFGVVVDKEDVYNIRTNANQTIKIMKFVNGIILNFINNKKVNVLSYVPNSEERDKIFKIAVTNLLSDKFLYYKAKDNYSYTTYLISKKILK